MLRSYKVHSEQIENVAKTFRDLYHTPRIASRTGNGKILPGAGSKRLPLSPQNAATSGPARKPAGSRPVTAAPGSDGQSIPVIRCFQCGYEFPVTDFLYTKKSGLCIPCWEAKVV